MLNGFGGKHAIYIQQRFDHALDLGHADDVFGGNLRAEVERFLDVARGDVENFLDAIHDESHLRVLAVVQFDLDDDDAGLLGIFDLETETQPQVNHRNNLAAQIDDALDVFGHLGHGRDVCEPDDFAHFEDINPIGFALNGKREILAGDLLSVGRSLFQCL